MEILSLSPLHLLLGITNKLYDAARPSDNGYTQGNRTLDSRHRESLVARGIRRSSYFDGALEGNGCSRLLDAVYDDEIPFAASAEVYVTALKALKVVKDMCFGLTRQAGWRDSIVAFRSAWSNTGLRWTPKVHILCDHVVEYLENYEADDDVGLGLSSEQSGESLHARVQRVWNQLFKVNADNELFSQRLIDCMVTYNWNLQWDEAQRSMGGMKSCEAEGSDEISDYSSTSEEQGLDGFDKPE
ncbi:hypothetical protein FOZ60_008529 [Perkinsus olseni]|uniref:Uncharacterized protein n=1 Tax=Perkinsus olseni TaxID=32597 RepID=A0A7J6NK82_PEROL|nr:hypothetical protein FOZ60_008529 [Perkinsus olseni]